MEGISSNEATSFWFYQCGHAVFISHLKNVLLMDSHLMGEAFFVRSRVELLIKKLSTRMESQSYKKTCKARGRKQVITPLKLQIIMFRIFHPKNLHQDEKLRFYTVYQTLLR